ncbi:MULTISPECIES: hypothetical protein [unclassified Roseofilum]|uniref:hypothetical protein n=1 Tax=unclassified Roseofilum TaxID=2620099 RepID=UPI001B225465|nr:MULTISPECIES: hypothetical protein [unclassified Roseofilum]MBP0011336.1 hypothetical protein [Roseofilum sp. Belize Diploria]MBP0033599.1 hypothetical protein [Roseofilum sp. Belize BBD 4]
MSIASDLAKAIIDVIEGNQVKADFEGKVAMDWDVNYDTDLFIANVQLPISGSSWNNTSSKLETDIADSLEAKP